MQLTAGQLKMKLESIPDETIVCIERVEDIYFEKHGIPYEYPGIKSTDIKKKKVGRNDPCPCGSGKKFKKCCLGKGIYD